MASQKTKILDDDQPTDLILNDTVARSPKKNPRIGETMEVVHGPTSELTDDLVLAPVDSSLGQESKDYFNQVTDSLRRQHTESKPEADNRSRGLVPMILALVGVIALLVWGWIQVTAPKSAEQLFAEIERSNEEPEKVTEEISSFLKNYPDDPRAESLAELRSIGTAIKDYRGLKNTLTVRARAPGGLTDVEQKFLELANLAKESPDLAAEKMAAFALVNEAIVSEDRDLKCVEAAKSYLIKWNYQRKVKAESQLARIRNAFAKANEMEEPQQALELNQSILNLYSDTNFSALPNPAQGAQVLRQIRSRVTELENRVRMEAVEAEKKRMQEEQNKTANQANERSESDQDPKPSSDGDPDIQTPAEVEPDAQE